MNPARGWPMVLAVVLMGCVSAGGPATLKEGVKAPPVAGEDALGRNLSLEEHRGKVVLLSFWHTQCPPCRAMFPHEKAMVQRFADRPFVLLGVNADGNREMLRRTQEKSGLTWASFWDGPSGPIAATWEVECFPTFVLIDKQGVVRFRQAGVPPEGLLEGKIEELLQEK